MTTTLRKELIYDAPLEEVAAMVADRGYREEAVAAQGWNRSEVSVEGSKVHIEMFGSTSGLPSFAQKFVGDEIHIVREETWTSPAHADVHITIPGKPGDVRGTAALTESGGTTTEVVDLEIKVSIPLVGGKIEKLIADMLGDALDAEHRVGVARLGR